jgi:hypothetical protein
LDFCFEGNRCFYFFIFWLLVKSKSTKHNYLLNEGWELENDSTLLLYYPPFIVDEYGAFRPNGLWLYAEFNKTGIFPFQSKETHFDVDSMPLSWNKQLPKQEGIYYCERDSLILISKEQSEGGFNENEITGFYFIPNKGRLFDRINIIQFE